MRLPARCFNPASTQWDIVNAQAKHIEPVHAELIRQAAEGDVLYNDDTTIQSGQTQGEHVPAASVLADL